MVRKLLSCGLTGGIANYYDFVSMPNTLISGSPLAKNCGINLKNKKSLTPCNYETKQNRTYADIKNVLFIMYTKHIFCDKVVFIGYSDSVSLIMN